jgi:putative RNA 2'-phosphotransferase
MGKAPLQGLLHSGEHVMSAEKDEPGGDGERPTAPAAKPTASYDERTVDLGGLLNRSMAFLLRHSAAKYRITLNPEGWADSDSVARALRRLHPRFRSLSTAQIVATMPTESSDRFEVMGRRIRARYGHSVKTVTDFGPEAPPETLYHGTRSPAEVPIFDQGLRPMWRVYVHLTSDVGYAERVARTAGNAWVVLRVRAGDASRAGVVFRRASPTIWLAGEIAPQFIEPIPVLRGPGP